MGRTLRSRWAKVNKMIGCVTSAAGGGSRLPSLRADPLVLVGKQFFLNGCDLSVNHAVEI